MIFQKEKDDIHLPEYAPVISFESPIENQTYDSSSAVIIKISHQSKFGLSQIDYYFNNNYLGSLNQEPYVFTFKPSSFNINENDSEIKIITYDKVRNKTEKKILIKINR